jgi:hypothetical protein
MGFRKISHDLKLAAIRLYERNPLSLRDILRILRLWRETGGVVNHQPSTTMGGRLRALDCEDINCLLRLVRQNPDYFLDELMHLTN